MPENYWEMLGRTHGMTTGERVKVMTPDHLSIGVIYDCVGLDMMLRELGERGLDTTLMVEALDRLRALHVARFDDIHALATEVVDHA